MSRQAVELLRTIGLNSSSGIPPMLGTAGEDELIKLVDYYWRERWKHGDLDFAVKQQDDRECRRTQQE